MDGPKQSWNFQATYAELKPGGSSVEWLTLITSWSNGAAVLGMITSGSWVGGMDGGFFTGTHGLLIVVSSSDTGFGSPLAFGDEQLPMTLGSK